MAQLKAIETHYKGYRFRSRLEARWAVFFDALGLKWEYEPQGYRLPSGQLYLPDFKVYGPQGEPVVYEIKPENSRGDGKYQEYHAHRQKLWSDLTRKERAKKRAPRGNLLQGDPIDFFGIDLKAWGGPALTKNCMCPGCGVIAAFKWMGLKGDDRERLIQCYPCIEDIESRYASPSTIAASDLAWDGVQGIYVKPRLDLGSYLRVTTTDQQRLNRALVDAASEARKARFEHGEQQRFAPVVVR